MQCDLVERANRFWESVESDIILLDIACRMKVYFPNAVILIVKNEDEAVATKDLFLPRMKEILGDRVVAVICSESEHVLDFS